ncbi:pyrimidine dimer DNA glycosylase/endonuclease V [Athalassotoga saccharophila]|uniref:pyrimidine dimer DNA glycosylase/endonuclease V n=1 Tax=Athalassotoga saccharophila TaxID=1441386 RepID=UPI00137A767E|nr:pyrimidine dimer DNA glycosylase/endonuclease V [Athalassotoga saccharophila]BBJ27450.1 pyrimidine dimer DNA glycosylase [Athalassotoga saccharophila]
MRLWSIHPSYLDQKGLVAVWRESLLAKAVLEGKTRGYVNHPQLLRFKNSPDPLKYINAYIESIYKEALKRGYKFDGSKFSHQSIDQKLPVTYGQLKYEFDHLRKKLRKRDPDKLNELEPVDYPDVNPIFYAVDGPIEKWEKV